MQADVYSLVTIHVDFALGLGAFLALDVGLDDVVGIARGDALGELTTAVGDDFPLGLVLIGAADLDLHAISRLIVGRPDGAKDERVGRFLLFTGSGEAQ